MNKQSKDTSTGGAGAGGSGDGTNGFKMPKLNENVVKVLKHIAGFLKDNWQYILLIGAAIKGLQLMSRFSKLLGALGLGGVSTALTGILALIGAIGIAIGLIKFGKATKEVSDMNQKVVGMTKGVVNETQKVNKVLTENAKQYEKGSHQIKEYVNGREQEIEIGKTLIERYRKENEEITGLEKVVDIFAGTSKKNDDLRALRLQSMASEVAGLQELAKEGKLTDEQMALYTTTMKYLDDESDKYLENLKKQPMLMNKSKEELLQYFLVQNEMPFATSKTTAEFLRQYNQLKKNDSAMFGLKNIMKELDKVVISPKLKMKTNLDEVKKQMEKLAMVPVLGDIAKVTLNKLKTLGLAKGGIVNNPGRGVPITNVITGEATNGAEGVVPMNNDEAMDVLGRAIARHVQINLTNNTMLDSKVIARSVSQIQDSTNFITNGRGA